LQHVYVLCVVILGWVIFRADNLTQAWKMIVMMFTDFTFSQELYQILNPYIYFWIMIGVVSASGIGVHIYNWFNDFFTEKESIASPILWKLGLIVYGSLCTVLSLMSLTSSTHKPFIYFRF